MLISNQKAAEIAQAISAAFLAGVGEKGLTLIELNAIIYRSRNLVTKQAHKESAMNFAKTVSAAALSLMTGTSAFADDATTLDLS